MTLKCASDSMDNTDLPCTHLVLLYEKFAVQCPIENIRTGREIHELVTVRFVPNKSTGILVLSEHFWDIICSVWIIYE